jgi:hypothetical protein
VETGDDRLPSGMSIEVPDEPLDPELMERLRSGLLKCPDVAFAHLPQVFVAGQHGRPNLVLFVWLVPEALRSLRMALNAVSEVVARVLPREQYLDVVILNSAPEWLESVEAAGCLVVERDAEERRKALWAARKGDDPEPPPPRRRWWW